MEFIKDFFNDSPPLPLPTCECVEMTRGSP